MIYKLYCANFPSLDVDAVTTVGVEPQISFIFDPANTDYQNFKKQINADEAQLLDADGNLMTAEQAKDFVKELP